mgnify:CR=1 FL=1
MRRNFLTELIREQKPRRQCEFEAIVYYCRHGLREYTAQKVTVIEISTATCKVLCPVPDAITGHVYLVVERMKAKIPCAVLRRGKEDVELKFYEEVPEIHVARMCAMR